MPYLHTDQLVRLGEERIIDGQMRRETLNTSAHGIERRLQLVAAHLCLSAAGNGETRRDVKARAAHIDRKALSGSAVKLRHNGGRNRCANGPRDDRRQSRRDTHLLPHQKPVEHHRWAMPRHLVRIVETLGQAAGVEPNDVLSVPFHHIRQVYDKPVGLRRGWNEAFVGCANLRLVQRKPLVGSRIGLVFALPAVPQRKRLVQEPRLTP